MKRILALWLATMLIAVQPCYAVVCVGFGQVDATCSTTSFFSESAETANAQITSSAAYAYAGGYWNGSPFTLCKVDVWMVEWLGETDSKSYVVSVYSQDGTTFGALKGQSGTASFGSETKQYVSFSFATPVAVATGDIIVLSEVSPVADSSNFLRVYSNNARDSDFDYATWSTTFVRNGSVLDGTTPSFRLYAYE